MTALGQAVEAVAYVVKVVILVVVPKRAASSWMDLSAACVNSVRYLLKSSDICGASR